LTVAQPFRRRDQFKRPSPQQQRPATIGTALDVSVLFFVACSSPPPSFVCLLDAARRMRVDHPVAKAPPLLPAVEQDSCLSQWLQLRCHLVLNPPSPSADIFAETMSGRTKQRQEAATHNSDQGRSRSRSRERDAVLMRQPSRQLRSVTRAAAAIDAAYGDRPHSISRLHDDELACVLPFLSLEDLACLVRCSRRFNGVARKERSRGLEVAPAINSIPSLARSSLNHHITSMGLARCNPLDSHITRATLLQLRSLPQARSMHIQ
jgi:hypothetical protein